MHFLLIVLLLIIIWRIVASHDGPADPHAIRLGLKRLGLVLAVLAAGLGGIVGYGGSNEHFGGAIVGSIIGFTVIRMAMSVVIWIISGFMGR
jgi:hypothetical protein